MKAKIILPTLLVFVSLFFTACLEDAVDVTLYHYTDQEHLIISNKLDLPNDLVNYQVSLADHMRRSGMFPPDISNSKATLGRVLFYDKELSLNKSVSCASCHHQEAAFSDVVAHSEGFDGELTPRNSLALGAVANFASSYGTDGSSSLAAPPAFFFWDERARTIEEQSLQTIQDDVEMGLPMHELRSRVQNIDYYKVLFKKAYGDDVVTEQRILESLQQFINAIISTQSKFDAGLNKVQSPLQDFSNFTAQENKGKALYMDNCASCHGQNLSTVAVASANNGLGDYGSDHGKGSVTGFSSDQDVFKVPFLRNIAVTGPYMHDGRFETLEEVVEHYNSGIEMHQNLHVNLRSFASNRPKEMNMNTADKEALIAFLHTLTDPVLLTETRYSDPFK